MAEDIELYVNTETNEVTSAFVVGTDEPLRKVTSLPSLIVGGKRSGKLYLIRNDGTFDDRSGDNNYTVSIGAGPIGATPTDGTFTLTDGTDTTAALDYNLSASDLQAALNALNSDAGPFNDTVKVTSAGVGIYLIKFDTAGAVAGTIAGDATELVPSSAIYSEEAVTGDVSTREQQVIRLRRQPIAFTNNLTPITDGWSFELNASNARALEFLAIEGARSVETDFDIEIETGSETPENIARGRIRVSDEIINPAMIEPDEFPLVLLNTDRQIPRNRFDLTGLIGGTSTDLDSVETTALQAGWLFILPNVTIGASVPSRFWTLKAGTNTEDPALGIVLPDDYNALTNAKYWEAV